MHVPTCSAIPFSFTYVLSSIITTTLIPSQTQSLILLILLFCSRLAQVTVTIDTDQMEHQLYGQTQWDTNGCMIALMSVWPCPPGDSDTLTHDRSTTQAIHILMHMAHHVTHCHYQTSHPFIPQPKQTHVLISPFLTIFSVPLFVREF